MNTKETKSLEELKNKYLGEIGSPERDDYETKLFLDIAITKRLEFLKNNKNLVKEGVAQSDCILGKEKDYLLNKYEEFCSIYLKQQKHENRTFKNSEEP